MKQENMSRHVSMQGGEKCAHSRKGDTNGTHCFGGRGVGVKTITISVKATGYGIWNS
jgi:hypothetical protein